jgi:hypothetical protein
MTQKEISIQNQNELKVLTERINAIEKTTDKTSDNVKKILFYFNSDADTKSEGLIEKTNRIDGEVRIINELVGKGKFGFWLVSAISGFIGGLITLLFKIRG